MKNAFSMFYRWCGLCLVSVFSVGNLTAAAVWTDRVTVTATYQGGTIQVWLQEDTGDTWKPEGATIIRFRATLTGAISASPTPQGEINVNQTKTGQTWNMSLSGGSSGPATTGTEFHYHTLSGSPNPDRFITLNARFYGYSGYPYAGVNHVTETVTWDPLAPPPEPKEVFVLFINNDDRDWFATFEGEEGPRAVTIPYGGNNSMTLEEDELPDASRYGTLAATRTMRELHKGEWYYQAGTFYDSNAEAGLTHTYQWKVSWGPLSKADAKDPANQFTVTIGAGAAKEADSAKFTAANDAWVIPEPTEETPEPVAPTVKADAGPSPVAEINKKTHQYLIKTIDPETGQSQLQGYFGPLTGTAVPTTGDGEAIIEALGEIQGRSEKMHQLGILQGEDGAQVAKGQLGALDLADKAGQGMGGEGTGAGEAMKELIGKDEPQSFAYTPGEGTLPAFGVKMPAAFGGSTFNMNPFEEDRMGPIATWFRSAVHWAVLVGFGVWIWKEFGVWARALAMTPQAKGNAVLGGTGGQATALAAAGLITAAVVAAVTALLAWSFENLSFAVAMSFGLTVNPMATIGTGILWMLNAILPVTLLITVYVGRMIFNAFAATIFGAAAAVIRFIVP